MLAGAAERGHGHGIETVHRAPNVTAGDSEKRGNLEDLSSGKDRAESIDTDGSESGLDREDVRKNGSRSFSRDEDRRRKDNHVNVSTRALLHYDAEKEVEAMTKRLQVGDIRHSKGRDKTLVEQRRADCGESRPADIDTEEEADSGHLQDADIGQPDSPAATHEAFRGSDLEEEKEDGSRFLAQKCMHLNRWTSLLPGICDVYEYQSKN